MSLKLVLCFVLVFLAFGLGLKSEEKMASGLTVELVCRRTVDLLDTELEGTLINGSPSPIDVTIPLSSFPFEVELADKTGKDLLARYRRPSPTYRHPENTTQTIHLEASGKKTFKATLRQYLESKGFPMQVDQAAKLRLLIAQSTDNSKTFSIIRSNSVDLDFK